jgi:hypothetical protein
MAAAQVAETARQTNREVRTADAPTETPDASLTVTDKVVVISFLSAVALFGLISVIDLVTSPFR